MSSAKIITWIGLLGTSLGLVFISAKPMRAQQVQANFNKTDYDSLKSVSVSNVVSTKASDLLLPTEHSSYLSNSSNQAYELAQRELDLNQFCQDYPLNSQCRGNKPDRNRNPSTIPVPTPPPASPSRTRDISNNQSKSGWAIVPEVSTLGLGGNIVRKITPQLNARVGVNGFSLALDGIIDTDVDYEADLNLFNVSTILDIHPFKSSGFRLSGGLVFGNNNIDGTADVSDEIADEIAEIDVNGQTIDVGNTLDGLVTADADIDLNNSVSPYVGIGGGNPVGEGKGLGFWWNLGVVFSGSPDVEVTTNISDQVPGELTDEVEAAANEVIEDQEEEIEDEIDFLNIYPVVSLGFSYQF